ncbi:MAG: hypothetical protein M0010_06600, partial [Actinomycetota bacterium]|nr:hypothetical protein [Actinomycetota bacterium]
MAIDNATAPATSETIVSGIPGDGGRAYVGRPRAVAFARLGEFGPSRRRTRLEVKLPGEADRDDEEDPRCYADHH